MNKKSINKKLDRRILFGSLALIIVTTLTYFPALKQATIYRDDWYYTVDRLKGGPQTFLKMFEIDRPARGYFFEAYYQLFGIEPTPYHMVGFGLRLLVGLLAFWFFRLLWPEHTEAALVMSLLFILYPGYTRWLEGIEDQPKIFSLGLEVLSFATSIKAILTSNRIKKVLWWIMSILTGLGYILLIDYAMGMEVFRFLCIFFVIDRILPSSSWLKKARNTLFAWAPAVLISGIFLYWRLLIFHSERAATDIGLQLSVGLNSPVRGVLAWMLNLFRSAMNQTVLAWWAPYFQDFFGQSNRELFKSLLLAGCIVAVVSAALLWLYKSSENHKSLKNALWIGSIGVTVGLIPVILANRVMSFGAFSHYAVPASLASAILVGGVVYSISSRKLRISLVAVLILLAFMNHTSVSTIVLKEEQVIADFWHQVAWRAPNIRAGTTLTVNYPEVNYGEDVDAVNGPANFIYYPDYQGTLPVTYPLFATKQYFWTSKEILSGEKLETGYRTNRGSVDPTNVLVISQPSKRACVHIINAQFPWFSYNDPDYILISGVKSNIDNVMGDRVSPQLDPAIFGPEPDHTWCYYFEKAELAVQEQDWSTILSLAVEVEAQKLIPYERSEWMPFLQAYAVSGNETAFLDTYEKIFKVTASGPFSSDDAKLIGEFNRLQSCNVLTMMQKEDLITSSHIQEIINSTICR